MRTLKKYPNRRLYDTQDSRYVTVEDVRGMVLANETIKVVDSRSDEDLTRGVLLQIIAELEAEGHEPVLTNRLLENIIRFYGDSMQGMLGRYLEQALMVFLDQQTRYQRRMREVLNNNPLKVMQRFADQNVALWRTLLQQPDASAEGGAPRAPGTPDEAPGYNDESNAFDSSGAEDVPDMPDMPDMPKPPKPNF